MFLDRAGVFVLPLFQAEHIPTDIFKEKENRKKKKKGARSD